MADDTQDHETTDPQVLARPKLRRIDKIAQTLDGEQVLILRDPLGVAESFALDAEFAPVLELLDGTRQPKQIGQSLRMRGVLDLPQADLDAFVGSLSDAGWLDDDRFRDRWAALHAEFLDTDPRAPRFAGVYYPDDPQQLAAELHAVLGPASPRGASRGSRIRSDSELVGLLIPHAPVDRMATVVEETLRDLPPADSLDTVVILGTDHGPGLLPYAVARRGFATPLGDVRADTALLDAIDRRLPWAYREEVRHRDAHSIELSVLILQALYGDAVPPIVPVLCGAQVLRARNSEAAERFVATLEGLLEGRRVLVWGSAELSHAGVAYGRPSLDDDALASVRARDEACLQDFASARHRVLASRCAEDHPQGRPSGGAVLTTLRQLLPDARVEVVRYHASSVSSPNDEPDQTSGERSVVGLAGVRLWRRPGS